MRRVDDGLLESLLVGAAEKDNVELKVVREDEVVKGLRRDGRVIGRTGCARCSPIASAEDNVEWEVKCRNGPMDGEGGSDSRMSLSVYSGVTD